MTIAVWLFVLIVFAALVVGGSFGLLIQGMLAASSARDDEADSGWEGTD